MSESPEQKPPQDLLDWLGYTNAPNWRVARPLGRIFGAFVVVVFAVAIAAAVSVLYGTIRDVLFSETPQGPNLGAGALIAALLGAPFLIWGTVLKHQTVRWAKDGHMTDRISKAVEQLGAEKKVDRIGRSVELKRWGPDTLESDENVESRTAIEWRDKTLQRESDEWIGEVGQWQLFSETVPNLEVRIGAILSLERIAQDSTTHDRGRDHVRVMEILCAYIRENSNATPPQDYPEADWESLADDVSYEDRKAHLVKRTKRFGNVARVSKARIWAQSLPKPRADVAQALQVLGRRTAAQRRVETAWPAAPEANTRWPFDEPCQLLADKPGENALTVTELRDFKAKLASWQQTLSDFSGYRLDLRGANLQSADLSARRPDRADAVFSGALLHGARMEGASLNAVRMEGVDLWNARIEGTVLWNAWMNGANFWKARIEGADLTDARMVGANFSLARLEGANLARVRLEGANLWRARMEVANLMGARMEGAMLSAVRLEGAELTLARLEGADLTLARMDGATLNLARLERADLTDARMEGVEITPQPNATP